MRSEVCSVSRKTFLDAEAPARPPELLRGSRDPHRRRLKLRPSSTS